VHMRRIHTQSDNDSQSDYIYIVIYGCICIELVSSAKLWFGPSRIRDIHIHIFTKSEILILNIPIVTYTRTMISNKTHKLSVKQKYKYHTIMFFSKDIQFKKNMKIISSGFLKLVFQFQNMHSHFKQAFLFEIPVFNSTYAFLNILFVAY
jgi:hypothetical protein